MGDMSSPHLGNMDDVRRNLGGGGRGGGSTFVVVVLVIAVAIGFWYLATHRTPEVADKKPETAKPALEPPKSEKVQQAAAAKSPTELPGPNVIGEPQKPAPEAQKALEAPKLTPTTTASGAVGKPAVAKPEAPKPEQKKAEPQKPKPHKPAAPAHKDEPVRLPHLPSPPPADDNP
jgi:cytoskeletal protein RodZ